MVVHGPPNYKLSRSLPSTTLEILPPTIHCAKWLHNVQPFLIFLVSWMKHHQGASKHQFFSLSCLVFLCQKESSILVHPKNSSFRVQCPPLFLPNALMYFRYTASAACWPPLGWSSVVPLPTWIKMEQTKSNKQNKTEQTKTNHSDFGLWQNTFLFWTLALRPFLSFSVMPPWHKCCSSCCITVFVLCWSLRFESQMHVHNGKASFLAWIIRSISRCGWMS